MSKSTPYNKYLADMVALVYLHCDLVLEGQNHFVFSMVDYVGIHVKPTLGHKYHERYGNIGAP